MDGGGACELMYLIATTGCRAAFDPLFGNKAALFHGRKFEWIGSGNSDAEFVERVREAEEKTFRP